MKRSFGRTIFVSLALVLGLGSAALAQPESSGWHEIRIIQVKPDMVGEYTAAIRDIVVAHQKHDQGVQWAAFSSFTGSGTTYSYYILMEKIGDMDAWLPNPQILAEAHGAKKAAKIIKTLAECSEGAVRLLAPNAAVSNPEKKTGLTDG